MKLTDCVFYSRLESKEYAPGTGSIFFGYHNSSGQISTMEALRNTIVCFEVIVWNYKEQAIAHKNNCKYLEAAFTFSTVQSYHLVVISEKHFLQCAYAK